jgi:hypothetical protein
VKFTSASVRTLTLPPGKCDHTYWDPDLPGHGIRLREGGSSNFIVEYKASTGNRRTRRMTLGSVACL